MNGLRIDGTFNSPIEELGREKKTTETPLVEFKKILSQSIGEVNQQLLQADEDTREMMEGKKDVHQAMISLEQANISMRLLVQVRNKIISAYEEIMRMQM